MSLLNSLSNRARRRPQAPQAPAVEKAIWDGVLIDTVTGQDHAPRESRIREGYIHVSSLLRFCPRMYRLAEMDNMVLSEQPSSADRVVWAIGKACEAHIRDSFIAGQNFKGVYGNWSCACGATTWEGLHRLTQCDRCGGYPNHYGEWTVFNHELRISGNPDLLWIVKGKMLVVEIKSINKKDFDKLSEPTANHVFQSSCYHKMLAEGGQLMHPDIVVFYVCKDYSFRGSPYLEFHRPAQTQYPIINGAFDQVRRLRASESGRALPDKLAVCRDPNSPTAKACPVCTNCQSRR